MAYTAKISRVSDPLGDQPPCEGAMLQEKDGWEYWTIEFDDIGELIDRLNEELLIENHTETQRSRVPPAAG